MSHIYASGNIAADMAANIAAESTGRTLAVRLYNMTDDEGMRDMLQYLIARDTMHQNQWMAALDELGGSTGASPIPNSHPHSEEKTEFSYAYLGFQADASAQDKGRWSQGPSSDEKDDFTILPMALLGQVLNLDKAKRESGTQTEQM